MEKHICVNLQSVWLYPAHIPTPMNLLPASLFVITASISHAQRMLEPVSVYINQHGRPVIETYDPREVQLFLEEDEIVSSDNGYEIDSPCIYTHHWYRITPHDPIIFDNSTEYDTSVKEFALFSSARRVYFTALFPELDNYQPYLFFPYYSPPGFEGFSDTTITHELYPYSFWDGYYQSPPRHEFLDVTYRSPNQIALIRHGAYSSDSAETKTNHTNWICEYDKDYLSHVEIISQVDSMQYSSEELPSWYYKKNAYMHYDEQDRLEYILVHKGDTRSSTQKMIHEVEDSLRQVFLCKNEYLQSEMMRQITDSNYCVSGFLHYAYTGDYLTEVIAFTADFTGVRAYTFEYDTQKRLTKVIDRNDQEIHSVLEFTYSKRKKQVHTTRQIFPVNGE